MFDVPLMAFSSCCWLNISLLCGFSSFLFSDSTSAAILNSPRFGYGEEFLVDHEQTSPQHYSQEASDRLTTLNVLMQHDAERRPPSVIDDNMSIRSFGDATSHDNHNNMATQSLLYDDHSPVSDLINALPVEKVQKQQSRQMNPKNSEDYSVSSAAAEAPCSDEKRFSVSPEIQSLKELDSEVVMSRDVRLLVLNDKSRDYEAVGRVARGLSAEFQQQRETYLPLKDDRDGDSEPPRSNMVETVMLAEVLGAGNVNNSQQEEEELVKEASIVTEAVRPKQEPTTAEQIAIPYSLTRINIVEALQKSARLKSLLPPDEIKSIAAMMALTRLPADQVLFRQVRSSTECGFHSSTSCSYIHYSDYLLHLPPMYFPMYLK